MLAKAYNTCFFYWHLCNADSMLFDAIAEDNSTEGIQYALNKGADIINARDIHSWILNTGNSALHAAIEFSVDPAIMVSFLIEKGADVNAKSTKGITVLSFACKPIKYLAANPKIEAFKVVKLLLENGANISLKNADGSTALESAVKGGSLDIVNLLLEKGAEVEAKLLDCVTGPNKAEISEILSQKLDSKLVTVDKPQELTYNYGSHEQTSEELGYKDLLNKEVHPSNEVDYQ